MSQVSRYIQEVKCHVQKLSSFEHMIVAEYHRNIKLMPLDERAPVVVAKKLIKGFRVFEVSMQIALLRHPSGIKPTRQQFYKSFLEDVDHPKPSQKRINEFISDFLREGGESDA